MHVDKVPKEVLQKVCVCVRTCVLCVRVCAYSVVWCVCVRVLAALCLCVMCVGCGYQWKWNGDDELNICLNMAQITHTTLCTHCVPFI